MEQYEQDLVDKINAATSNVKVPDNLKPEQIEKQLQEKEIKQKNRKWKSSYTFGLATACCLLIVSVVILNISKSDGTITAEKATTTTDAVNNDSTIATAKNYDEIYKYIQNSNSQNGTYITDGALESATTANQAESKSTTATAADTSGAGKNYSNTNIRQEGVDEGDYVKTDGNYLYVLKSNGRNIVIVDLKTKQMEEVATIELGKNARASEFYIIKNKLVAMYSETVTQELGDEKEIINSLEYTKATTFDISDPKNPEELGSVSQSGSYYSSRLVGDYVYLFSQFYTSTNFQKADASSYIPEVQGNLLEKDRIYMPIMPSGNMYTVISSFDITKPNDVVDSKAVFSDYDICYVSNENIYMYSQIYAETAEYTQTAIRKIAYKDGRLEAIAQCKVKGTIDSTFSIDEYNGNLRMVVTVNPTSTQPPIAWFKKILPTSEEEATNSATQQSEVSNALYILDAKLQLIGQIEGVAKGETVYSARFLGDVGYFVTYRQTDPLFSVDLSNPKNPKIIGQLKIPGFSEYLHFYGADKLIGIGQDMDETGMTSNGVKISIFDISDPSNVVEEQKYTIEGAYSSDVFYDYKAVLIDVEKNIIGFSAYSDVENYYLFSYDNDNGFTMEMEEDVNGNGYQTTRGVYVGNKLYVVKGDVIEAYSLKDYKKIDDIIL